MLHWPEGSICQKEIHGREPDGWNQTNWAWRSTSHVDRAESVYPKDGKAECCQCLGAFECQECSKVIHPNMKTSDRKAQFGQGCPDRGCSGQLVWSCCRVQTYHFVIKEDDVQYSILDLIHPILICLEVADHPTSVLPWIHKLCGIMMHQHTSCVQETWDLVLFPWEDFPCSCRSSSGLLRCLQKL
jgi:hypothetical protein